jgi:hypothetical protein
MQATWRRSWTSTSTRVQSGCSPRIRRLSLSGPLTLASTTNSPLTRSGGRHSQHMANRNVCYAGITVSKRSWKTEASSSHFQLKTSQMLLSSVSVLCPSDFGLVQKSRLQLTVVYSKDNGAVPACWWPHRTQDNRMLVITIPKAEPGKKWTRLFRGDPDGVRCMQPPFTITGRHAVSTQHPMN